MTQDGLVDGVLMWWRLDMNPSGSIAISTSPLEELALGEPVPRRSHWQQGACVFRAPPARRRFRGGEPVPLRVTVRGWDVHFALQSEGEAERPRPPRQDPFAFPALQRHLLLRLADEPRLARLREEVRDAVRAGGGATATVLCLSDGLAGALAAVSAGTGARVVVLSSLPAAADRLRAALGGGAAVGVYARDGGGRGLVEAARALLQGRAAHVLVCEAADAALAELDTTWGLEEILAVWHRVRHLVRAGDVLAGAGAAGPRVVPCGLKVVCRAFAAQELRRRRAPVGDILGFDMGKFNEHAPMWRAHGVKRSSLMGCLPAWLSPRLECAVRWPCGGDEELGPPGESLALALEGAASGEGRCDGVRGTKRADHDQADAIVGPPWRMVALWPGLRRAKRDYLHALGGERIAESR
ncbi:unnamed protein product [Prorocentrum cordatum]|uniref:Uncharacterized protein n=1 Tax=Prorocentrum cordatum TaxID=2364126 RepID=A0ABN9WC33_9DINO|nr:unnamed protein product [Polarella glacialis]